MEFRFVPFLIAVVVGVVLVTTMLIPVISDATATEKTLTNDGYFKMSKISDADDDVTITWDYTKPYTFTVDGVDATIPFGSTSGDVYPYTIMCSEEWAVRFTSYNNGATIDLVLYGDANGLIWYSSTTDQKNVTFTFSSGTFTVSRDGGSSVTKAYTEAYYIDEGGDFIMKKGSGVAYVLADSTIYSVGRTGANFGGSNVNLNINIQASVSDGATVSIIYPDSGYTVSNEQVNTTVDSKYIGVYKFTNVTFDVTDSSSNVYSANYGQVIVPYQVTAELSQHMSDTEQTLVGIIPLLVIIGLVIGVLAIFARRAEIF